MRALVTGAAGFIGSNVVDRLLADGWDVCGLDNFDPYYDPAQKRRNLLSAQETGRFELIEADVRDAKAVSDAFDRARPDAVVHLAAKAGVRTSVADPVSYLMVNELGGLHVLMECQRRGNVPLAYASTSSVYGDGPVPFREDQPAMRPLSPYAASKRSGELMVHAFHAVHGTPVALLRFFTVYGPRGRPDMAVWSFTQRLLRGEPIRLHGERTARDFTFVEDIAAGVVGSLRWAASSGEVRAFNLGREEPVLVRELIEKLASKLGVTARVELGELQPGECAVTAADVGAARDAFGYAPQVSLDAGLERWVEWVRSSREAPNELRALLGPR